MFDLTVSEAGLARLTLNAPERLNALQRDHWTQLRSIARDLAARKDLRAVVLTGAGERAFSAGGDIKEFATIRMGADAAAAYNAEVDGALQAIADIPVPTLARIGAACFGGGLMMALACDLRFAAATASFCAPPAKMGFTYNAWALERLQQLVGRGHALDLLYTARTIDAAEARRIGLINEVAANDLDALLNQRLDLILNLAPLSHQAHKRLLNEAPAPGSLEERALTDHLYESQDYHEAVAAFTTRRRPSFKGQ